MILPSRRLVLGGALALAAAPPALAAPAITFAAAGPGSAFLPYARGLAPVLAAALGAPVEPRETGGSIENIGLVEGSEAAIGTVFLGSAFEAVTGTGFSAGRPRPTLRALFPMYETSFQAAALRGRGIGAARDLDAKRVGVGPAKGPAEVYFRGLAEAIGIAPVIVNGAPADLARALAEGSIDALWQGAVVPVPSLVDAGERADLVVFGLTEEEVALTRRRHPFMSAARYAPGTYKGQEAPILSVAAWNFVVADLAMPEATAHALTRAALTAPDLPARLGPPGRGTAAANAATNTVLPFHEGAARHYREAGVALPAR